MPDGTSLPISPFLGGDPVRLGPEIASADDVLEQLGLRPTGKPGCLVIASGVALIHSLTGDAGGMLLRWVNCPHRPQLGAGLPSVDAAAVLIAPIGDSARALRLVGRLTACLAAPGIADRMCAATTREVSPGSPELLGLLDSSPAGLSDAEAARRGGRSTRTLESS
jgi:hypothetical protein